ncbi:manganese efflux pump MntP family protein [uncultured Maricaulis sp.]|uniref:manganese efflux pump MntP n=1 Tax=uncultured Maricaulis sp. TaxID=174710 RepID=UPI0030D6D8B0|tara:strand:+ start:13062 stop:13625 length:564 start_codon:yes stop_codon:yes gene_type:complete
MINPAALVLTSFSLSTDAFAAALARGSAAPKVKVLDALRIGAVFGLSEGVMCLLGWSFAIALGGIVAAVDHWVALILLSVIGGRMIREGLSAPDEARPARRHTALGTVMTAIGTSIDSAAVGIALALAGGTAWAALAIGLASFAMSSAGYYAGPHIGARLGRHAELAGGAILILIGVSIFISHVMAG